MNELDGVTRRDRIWLYALAGLVVVFGVLTVHRSAFLSRRMGDGRMLFRAGWMARSGGDLYAQQAEYLLHYNYPPLLACLMVPLADPPEGTGAVALPYPVCVAIWYVCNVGFLALSTHLLAGAVMPGDAPGSRQWWAARVLPVLVCLPAIGSTLMQGQVTPLLLLLIAGGVAMAAHGRGTGTGFCIGLAACIKLFPAFLAVWPLWRFGSRAVIGITLACGVGLVVVPAVVIGPEKAADSYATLARVMLGPALGLGGDDSRGHELFNTRGPHSMSLHAAFNNAMHPDRPSRPDRIDARAKYGAIVASALMLLATLWVFARPGLPEEESTQQGLAWGALSLVMLLACPVAHLHYLMLALPAVIGLLAHARRETASARWVSFVAIVHLATVVVAQLPGFEQAKDKCLPTLGLVVVWVATCHAGIARRRATEVRAERGRLAA